MSGAGAGCVELEPGTWVCGGSPTQVIATEDVTRWCFGCRKRLPHTWEVLDHIELSPYDPWWVCRCSGCGQDRTEFPS